MLNFCCVILPQARGATADDTTYVSLRLALIRTSLLILVSTAQNTAYIPNAGLFEVGLQNQLRQSGNQLQVGYNLLRHRGNTLEQGHNQLRQCGYQLEQGHNQLRQNGSKLQVGNNQLRQSGNQLQVGHN